MLLLETQRIISAHRDFVFLVRDHRTLEFAERNFDCQITLCPDAAFGLGPLPRPEPVVDACVLLRTDKERLEDRVGVVEHQLSRRNLTFAAFDWVDDAGSMWRRANYKLNAVRARLPIRLPFVDHIAFRVQSNYSAERLAAGIALLGRGRCVVTDRIHGHILCMLLGIPHVLFDSLDGKVRAFHETWTTGSDLVRWANSVREFPDALDDVLERVQAIDRPH